MRLRMGLTAARPACSYSSLLLCSNQGWVQGALDGKAAVKVKGRIDNILQEVRLAEGPMRAGNASCVVDAKPGLQVKLKISCMQGCICLRSLG